jgi:hypothetical protein
MNSSTNELETKNSQIQTLTRVRRIFIQFSWIYFSILQERDDLRRQLSDVKKDFDKQNNILQKCLAVNKKLLVEKVCDL